MLSSEVAQSLKSYRHFRTLGSRSLSVIAMLTFSGKASTLIHGLGAEDTAKSPWAVTYRESVYIFRFVMTIHYLHEFVRKQKSEQNSSVFGHCVACCYCKECMV